MMTSLPAARSSSLIFCLREVCSIYSYLSCVLSEARVSCRELTVVFL